MAGDHLTRSRLAGFRLPSGDIGAFNGVEVIYVAERTVRKVYDYAALLCRSRSTVRHDSGSYAWSDQVLRDFGLVYRD